VKTLTASALAATAGVVLGIGLAAATLVMASAGPMGEGWSFRGNGALVVPIGIGGALLAGGWTGLSLFARGIRAWLPFAVALACAAATPAILSIALLAMFGRSAQAASDLMTVPALAWPMVSLAFAIFADVRPAPSRRLPRGSAVLASIVFSIAVGAGFALAEGGFA